MLASAPKSAVCLQTLPMKRPVYNPNWDSEIIAVYQHDIQEIWDPNISRQIWNQYHNQLDLYLDIAKKPYLNILDIGCAQGTLALELAESGHHVVAVDIRQHFLDYAASRYEHGDIRFVCSDIFHLDLNERFELIFANQIIEHIIYPQKFLKKLTCLLAPGGKLIVTTPNGQYLRNSLPTYRDMGDLSKYAQLQNTADADGHFFAYTATELINLFSEVGFKRISVKWFESPWISGHMKFRYLHGIIPVRLLRMFDRAMLSLPWIKTKIAHQILVQGAF